MTNSTFVVTAYGAIGDGVADDTVAIQAAITAAGAGHNIVFPPGVFVISSSLVMDDLLGTRLLGAGPRSTVLQWQGTSQTIAALVLASCHTCAVKDLSITVSTGYVLRAGIQMYSKSGPRTWNSKHNVIANVTIEATTNELIDGVRIGGDTAHQPITDANNDYHHLIDVDVLNHTGIAFSLENSQVYQVLLTNCFFASPNAGSRGVSSRDNPDGSGQGGNFIMQGGGGACVGTAFRIGGYNSGAIAIRNVDIERAERLLETSGPATGVFKAVVLDGVSYRTTTLHPDTFAIVFQFGGSLTVRASVIGASATQNLRVSLQHPAACSYVFDQCTFLSRNTTMGSLFPFGARVRVRDSVVNGVTMLNQ